MQENEHIELEQENLKPRTIYTTDEEWDFASRQAKKEYTTRTGLIRKLIREKMINEKN